MLGQLTQSAKGAVTPAIFTDPDKARDQLVDAWRAFDEANQAVAKKEHVNAYLKADVAVIQNAAIELDLLRRQSDRARSVYDVVFSIYQEAARARDAKAANELAGSNNATALASRKAAAKIAWLTVVLAAGAVAQIVQLVHTWSPHQ